ncbi:MAG: VOC family protein [Actinomycetota bacterium]
MLKISHVLYRVPDLDAAVVEYRDRGFDIDYGRAKNPINALAYFADGSYLELLGGTGMPPLAKRALKLFGKKAFIARLDAWDNAEEGLIGLALEAELGKLDEPKELLKEAGQGWFQFRSRRTEPSGRVLRFAGVMPDDLRIPFFGTCDTDLRREGFVHPNGVIGFKTVSFGTTEALLPLVERLCADDRLKLFIGDGVKDMEFEYADS